MELVGLSQSTSSLLRLYCTHPLIDSSGVLAIRGLTWSVDQPGMSPVVLDRRDYSDLGLWGVTWSVDQPGMSPGIPLGQLWCFMAILDHQLLSVEWDVGNEAIMTTCQCAVERLLCGV